MIKYRCEKDSIEVNGSTCPHCGQRAYPFQSEIYWCENCQIPNYNMECGICKKEGKRLSSDLRPVFPEEKILLEVIMEQDKEVSLKDMAIWNGSGNIYYGNGKRLGIKIGKLAELDTEKVCGR